MQGLWMAGGVASDEGDTRLGSLGSCWVVVSAAQWFRREGGLHALA